MSAQQKYFTQKLLLWHNTANQRSLPWKEEKDPYKIWLSEIILQQTRAEQGLKYYLNFIEKYPTIFDLAKANDEDVFRLWQGLGYYNRCKNMLSTARFIYAELAGKFPEKYENILALKGVGAYTAAAIGSFAFNLPYAVVDGNVYRVLSRYFGIETPIDSTEGKRYFSVLAQELLDKKNPAQYNQAIMDFGATVCTPKQPECISCPLSKNCIALIDNLIPLLPIKKKKLKILERFFNFTVLQYKDEVWIERRGIKNIWENLHQFYLTETTHSMESSFFEQSTVRTFTPIGSKLEFRKKYKQRLTHQLIESKFYTIKLKSKNITLPKDGFWVKIPQLKDYAFPKTIVDFIKDEFGT